MTWAEPANAWLFLLVLPAIGLVWRSTRIRRQYLVLLTGRGSQATSADKVALVVLTLVFILVVLALCRPQWGHVDIPRESRGLDILGPRPALDGIIRRGHHLLKRRLVRLNGSGHAFTKANAALSAHFNF